MNKTQYVAAVGTQIVVPAGEFRVVSDLAKAWAQANRKSPNVMTVAQFQRLPEQLALAQERRDKAALNAKVAKNADKARNKTRALVMQGQYTSEQLQQAIRFLASTGQHRNSNVLNKALRDEPLSLEQVAWIMGQASAHRSITATRHALA